MTRGCGVRLPGDPDGGSPGPLDDQIEAARGYLTRLAARKLDLSLTAKLGASDIVQDTLIEARRRSVSYRGHGLEQLRAWLKTILRHRLARERRRYLDSAKRDLRREACPVADGLSASGRGDLPDRGVSPSAQLVRREQVDALMTAIDRLPPHYRQVVLLRHERRWPFERIAREQLGLVRKSEVVFQFDKR